MTGINPIKILLATFALFGYFGIAIIGPIHMAHMVEMNMPMKNCPFADGEHGLCKMDPSEHLTIWRKFTLVVFPTVKVLLAMLISASFLCFCYFSLLLRKQELYAKRQRLKNTLSFYRKLFSQGVLDPRAP